MNIHQALEVCPENRMNAGLSGMVKEKRSEKSPAKPLATMLCRECNSTNASFCGRFFVENQVILRGLR